MADQKATPQEYRALLDRIGESGLSQTFAAPQVAPEKVLDAWQQMMAKKVDDIRFRLRGFEVKTDDKGSAGWVLTGSPLFPEEIIESICLTVSNYLDPVVTFSNLEERTISYVTIEAGNDLVGLAETYFESTEEKDIVKIKKVEMIIGSIVSLIHSAQTWAKDAGWMKVFKETEQKQTIVKTEGQPKDKGRFLGILPIK